MDNGTSRLDLLAVMHSGAMEKSKLSAQETQMLGIISIF